MEINTRYRVCNWLFLVARGSYALLAGKVRSSTRTLDLFDNGNIDEDVRADNERNNIVIPYSEIRLGVNVQAPMLCLCPSLELGYSWFRYTDFIDTIRWIGDRNASNAGTEGASFDDYGAFMGRGLYLKFGVCF